MFFQKGNCGFYPKISASARRGERDDRDGLAFIEIGLGKREVGRKNQQCGQNRTGCKIYSQSTLISSSVNPLLSPPLDEPGGLNVLNCLNILHAYRGGTGPGPANFL